MKHNWMIKPPRRTPAEQEAVNQSITAFMAINPCWYPLHPETLMPDALPKPEDKHQFTPQERIDLDFNGRF